MSDSEFSAAAGFSSGLIPKIDYFVVGTAEQVQSSVRDNLWYLRTDKVGCISKGVSISVLGPTARKKVSDGSLGTYYIAGTYYISRNKNHDSIFIQSIPVICSLFSYGFSPFSFKVASFHFGSPKVGFLRRDGVVNWFLTEFYRTIALHRIPTSFQSQYLFLRSVFVLLY